MDDINPSRWEQVEALFHAASAMAADDRAELLSRVDPGLRQEVESLLGQESGDGVLHYSVWDKAISVSDSGPEVPLEPGSQLGRYTIEALIGAGGMGRVYKARDTRLQRAVAIKISRQQFSERFEREAVVISSLNHSNICTLYDIGPNYLVMELIEGPTLAERISQPIEPDEAIRIAIEIAGALEAAHQRGIVHRDLKPSNIKLTSDGHVKVLDFGLAKMPADPISADGVSSPAVIEPLMGGAILGTAAYMSPEQAQGNQLDKRTDIWSFGIVLYEMLTGKTPFEGTTLAETLANVLKQPLDLKRTPAKIRPLLQQCLAKDRNARLRDIGDAILWLESTPQVPQQPSGKNRVWAAIFAARGPGAERRPRALILAMLLGAGAVIAAFTGWELWRKQTEPIRSIAVLPVRPVDSRSHADGLDIGLTDSLITRLSGSLDVAVRPVGSIVRYSGTTFDAATMGRRLKTDALLDTSLLISDDRVRITARLLRVRDGSSLWAGTFSERRDQLSRIDNAIVTQLSLLLNRASVASPSVAVPRGPAYENYLKGRYYWSQRTRAGILKAINYYQQAISAYPSYALAYAGLADAYIFEAGAYAPSHEVIPLARQAAEHAIQLDPHLAEPHNSLGLIAQNHELDWDRADREYRRALELNPRYALARHWYAEFLGHLGRFEESAREFELARELDPLSPAILSDMAKVDVYARNFVAAVDHGRAAIELDPRFYLAHVFLSDALAHMGHCEEAVAENRRAFELENSPWVLSTSVWIHSACNDREAARTAMVELLNRSEREWVSPQVIGFAWASLGNATQAVIWLNKAIEEPDTDVLSLKVAPEVDPVRKDVRFQGLMRQLGL